MRLSRSDDVIWNILYSLVFNFTNLREEGLLLFPQGKAHKQKLHKGSFHALLGSPYSRLILALGVITNAGCYPLLRIEWGCKLMLKNYEPEFEE